MCFANHDTFYPFDAEVPYCFTMFRQFSLDCSYFRPVISAKDLEDTRWLINY